MDWTSVLLSAVFAGVVATAVTVAIEKWGGLIGGLLGTVPSTIVPAGIGMYVAGGEDVLVMSMSVVPLGMLLNALFLGAWVVIPRWFPDAPYLLVLTTVGALAFWSLLGMVFLVAVEHNGGGDEQNKTTEGQLLEAEVGRGLVNRHQEHHPEQAPKRQRSDGRQHQQVWRIGKPPRDDHPGPQEQGVEQHAQRDHGH